MTKTEYLMQHGDVVNNPFQGEDKKVLFVCSAGILRSATGARLYAHKYNTRACGCYEYALIPISEQLIYWADEVVFVYEENAHYVYKGPLSEALKDANVKILSIPDMYNHMADELVQAFLDQYEPL